MEKGEDEGAPNISEQCCRGGYLGWLFDRIGLGWEILDSWDIANGSLELVETLVRCLI